MLKNSEPLPEKATIGELYEPAMRIKNKASADVYFEKLVQRNMSFGNSRQRAEETEKSNLGYFSGYYNEETMKRVQELFMCEHPIFGKV